MTIVPLPQDKFHPELGQPIVEVRYYTIVADIEGRCQCSNSAGLSDLAGPPLETNMVTLPLLLVPSYKQSASFQELSMHL